MTNFKKTKGGAGTDWKSMFKKMQKVNGKQDYTDERLYMPEYKEDNTAKATIRFLMSPDTDVPVISKYHHYFQGPGGWFVNGCPTTIKGKCPVCEDNGRLWAKSEDAVRKRKSSRKKTFYANILVVKDEKNPSNDGKVFLFKFGIKVYEKIEEVMNEGLIPFDDECGVNFTLRIKKIQLGNDLVPNYDSSNFSETETSISEYGNPEEINEKRYSLSDFINPSEFKQYDVLAEKLESVLGVKLPNSTQTEEKSEEHESTPTPKAEGTNDSEGGTGDDLGKEEAADFFKKFKIEE